MRQRVWIWVALWSLLSLPLRGQRPEWTLGFDQILDNREYFGSFGEHQTLFGARIDPGFLVSFDSVHRIRAGVNAMFEYGGDPVALRPQPDLSYEYAGRSLEAVFGFFARRDRLAYPRFFLRDSLAYYRPNVEGALVAYRWSWGRARAWVDRMGRADETTREAILAGVDLEIRRGPALLQGLVIRHHLARSEAPDDAHGINEDGALAVFAGVDLEDRFSLDRLTLTSGYVASHRWDRPEPNVWFNGWLSEAKAARGILHAEASYYRGDPSPLRYGEPLYASGNYGRFDLFVDPFRNPRIDSRIGWSFHFLPGDGLYHSQQILISVRL
ncbi:MAG: hypothetical protein R2751_00025 [Bacteroidales bacterium]